MIKTIVSFEDLLNVPPEKLEECLGDLKVAIELAQRARRGQIEPAYVVDAWEFRLSWLDGSRQLWVAIAGGNRQRREERNG